MNAHTYVLFFLAAGCTGDTPDDPGPVDDADGDGYTTAQGDCDDGDAGVHPGAEEVWYDGVDQNCDEASDYDQDGDGFENEEDCDDTDAESFPEGVATLSVAERDNDGDGTMDSTNTWSRTYDSNGLLSGEFNENDTDGDGVIDRTHEATYTYTLDSEGNPTQRVVEWYTDGAIDGRGTKLHERTVDDL